MTLTIQYASDLHLEMLDKIPDNIIIPVAPYLTLLGDIGDPYSKNYITLIATVSKQFEKVFLLAGNHEFYGNFYKDTIHQIRNVVSRYPNVIFLDNDIYELNGIRIYGAVLWSDVSAHAEKYIADYYHIKMKYREYLTREQTRSWFNATCVQIEHLIKDNDTPLLIFTHHAPHPTMSGNFQGGELCSAFTSDLTALLKKPVVAWLSGHTHVNMEVEINGVKLGANCYGYDKKERETYDNKKIITI